MECVEAVIWKKIPGFHYEVSNTGLVRNIESGKSLKPLPCGFGNDYLGVDLYRDGKGKRFKIHRLVGKLFLENKHAFRREVHHIDGNPLNNCADNLEWCTRLENERRKMFMEAVEELSGTWY